ncbi:MAG: hypothetical protein JWR06_586, partial [Jatrophihabitans sp.]|nr:hypothetical protein [Jatrophihabitans sp.]
SVRQRVVDIDRTIRHIRTSIFELRGPLDTAAEGTRRRVLDISADLAPALGFSPRVSFSGLIDNLSADLAEDVAAFVREVLTNVAKHARATCVDLDLTLASDQLTLQVIDDGVGYVENGRLSGLANLRTRAELHGGTFKVFAGHRGGTTVIWKAPLL